MCTSIDELKTKNFWKARGRKDKTWIWAYKFYNGEGKLPHTYFQDGQVYIGWNKSDRLSKGIATSEYDWGIDEGVHVCVNIKELKDWLLCCSHKPQVAKVKCFKKDFVACDAHGNAVFMKYFLPKAEYDKVVKNMKQGE